MSFEATKWARKQHPVDPDTKKRDPVAKNVLCALAERHNKDSGQCNPRIATICLDTDYSDAAVRKALDTLEEIGLITVERRHKLGNKYRLCGPLIRHDVADKDAPLSATSEDLSATSEDFYPPPRGAPIEQEEEEHKRTGSRASRVRAPSARPKRKSQRLEDFVPSIADAMKLGLSRERAEDEADRFRDHYLSIGGPRSFRADWDERFLSWIGKALEWGHV